MKRICVFCGSSPGSRPEYRAAAEELGTELARLNIGLVYGGGNVGLMGMIADAVLRAGGSELNLQPENTLSIFRMVRSAISTHRDLAQFY
jgi:hypothetical protein